MLSKQDIRTVLVFDTSLQGLSCGLVCFQKDSLETPGVFTVMRPMPRGQSETLIPDIQRLLGYAGCNFASLDLVVSTLGPGAFTGLRIGLSVAKAFRMTLDCPVIGLATPDILARQYCHLYPQNENRIRVVLVKKRQDFYTSLYDHTAKPLEEPGSHDIETLADGITENDVVIGDGTKRFIQAVPPLENQCEGGFDLIDPLIMAKTGVEKCEAAETAIGTALEPIYLRGADVSKSQKNYRVLSK